MTQLILENREIRVDPEKNQEWTRQWKSCDCPACRNYYRQIAGKYPELEELLTRMGLEIGKPEELPFWERQGELEYAAEYTLTGQLDQAFEISVGEQTLSFEPGDREGECTLVVCGILLPWVLREPRPWEPPKKPGLVGWIRNRFGK